MTHDCEIPDCCKEGVLRRHGQWLCVEHFDIFEEAGFVPPLVVTETVAADARPAKTRKAR